MIIKQGNSKAKVSAPKPIVQKPTSGGMKGGIGQGAARAPLKAATANNAQGVLGWI